MDRGAQPFALASRSLLRSLNALGLGEVVGEPLGSELVDQTRRRGATLLGESVEDIAEVALGYRPPPHFAKAFRAIHGMSPSEWRRAVHGVRAGMTLYGGSVPSVIARVKKTCNGRQRRRSSR